MDLRPRVLIVYSDSKHHDASASHKGTGVSVNNTAKVLTLAGYPTETWAIKSGKELLHRLCSGHPTLPPHERPFTHIVISALFLEPEFVKMLANRFPYIKFAVNCHSNVGFLQSEPAAIKSIRAIQKEELSAQNLFAAGNSERFCEAMELAYGTKVTHLPNLYYLSGEERGRRVMWKGGQLNIGIFGAERVQKNFSTAVVAALIIARELKAETHIWMNSGRKDKSGDFIGRAVKAWLHGVPGVTLHHLVWCDWAQFRKRVSSQHLLIQPSYSESFNIVTADGIAEGVPSVVSDAIYWVPEHWKSNADDATDVARVGRSLIYDEYAVVDGLASLKTYNETSLQVWKKWL